MSGKHSRTHRSTENIEMNDYNFSETKSSFNQSQDSRLKNYYQDSEYTQL